MPRGCFSVKIVCQNACIYESGYDIFFLILLEGILHVTVLKILETMLTVVSLKGEYIKDPYYALVN